MTRLAFYTIAAIVLTLYLTACAGSDYMQAWENECNAGKMASCIKMQDRLADRRNR